MSRRTPPLRCFALIALSTICCATAWGQRPKDPGYETTWVSVRQAKEKAQQARYGILYYFPTKGTTDEHMIFSTEEMSVQSRNSPMVKVATEKTEHLRPKYDVNDKFPTIVVTDWHGNQLGKFVARNLKDKKIKFAAIQKEIKRALSFVDGMEAKIEKSLAKANKSYDKKKYKSAIKELSWVRNFEGFKSGKKATDLLEEIMEIGREEHEKLLERGPKDKDELLKKLKKLAKEFKGTEVEPEIQATIKKVSAGKDE